MSEFAFPGHLSVQCELAEQVTVQLSVQTTSHVAPPWQVAEPVSPIVIWQSEPSHVTIAWLPATSVQLLPVAQVALHREPQLPIHV